MRSLIEYSCLRFGTAPQPHIARLDPLKNRTNWASASGHDVYNYLNDFPSKKISNLISTISEVMTATRCNLAHAKGNFLAGICIRKHHLVISCQVGQTPSRGNL